MSFIETLVILLVAVIVFGPKRLPEVARKVGKVTGALRRAGDEFRRQLMTMDQAVETRVSAVTRDLDSLVPEEDAAGFDPARPPSFTPFVPDGSIAGNGGPDVPLSAPAPEPPAAAGPSAAEPSDAGAPDPQPVRMPDPAPSADAAPPPDAAAPDAAREVRHG